MSNLNVVTSNPSVEKSNPSVAASHIDKANKGQSAQSLIIQTYANSVNEQPSVDFSGNQNLALYEKQINDGLATAQGHAANYLNNIQPNIIKNIANIDNYYTLHNAVPTILPEGSTEEQWVELLTVLKVKAAEYQKDANGVKTSLEGLTKDLSHDSQSFSKTVGNLNTAVNGDNGVLASDQKQLDNIQGKIDGAIAGIAVSGLTIAGGVFMIVVGGVADFVTAGTTTPLVVGGIGMVTGGIGGEVAAAITLKNLNDEKARLLREESMLEAEVKLASGISSSYQSLVNQVNNAVTAATQMKNAWGSLASDLGSMISDLQLGIISTGIVREMMLTATNGIIKIVLKDIDTIKGQMAGVTIIVAKPGQTVGEAIVEAAEALAA
ncbi:HBL/NHE enterotoxin family protein [Moritella sp. 28]|uniref:HBL/NHE enterotoxin family protein n=1 Tax=Moritella sp. 28 TaxID=2746232 RepID=UPI001BA4885D|nr:HBL/NHE enterotoxin family protein [Moritella sp. 28]QUM86270.1 HBL/NHE enterotoxin family protein [Moritella sp. 28]